MKGFVIAGTQSGVGKTSLSIGLMAAFRRRGLKVQPFKVGPDFIDPSHHEKACGVPSYNLDGWMMSRETNLECFKKHTENAGLAIVEGVMGLFDGREGRSEIGSTAQMAKWLGLPVILVVDAGAMVRSAAALVKGFSEFDPALKTIGVIFNKVASEKHLKWLTEALEGSPVKVLGGIFKNADLKIPERHLGLWMAQDEQLAKNYIEKLADQVESCVDLNQILEMESIVIPEMFYRGSIRNSLDSRLRGNDKPIRIGIARDKAFSFYYQDNFEMMKELGAELVFFSPLKDRLPSDLDALYFGGGYPELYAKELSENALLISELQMFASKGGLIYGECGGLMYLGKGLKKDEESFLWCDLLPFWTQMTGKCKLGYREVRVDKSNFFFPVDKTIRGHQFHYSEMIQAEKMETCYQVKSSRDETGQEGFLAKNILGSYIHLHFRSNPEFLVYFLENCLNVKRGQVLTKS